MSLLDRELIRHCQKLKRKPEPLQVNLQVWIFFSSLPKRAIHPKHKWNSRNTFPLVLNGKGLKEFQCT